MVKTDWLRLLGYVTGLVNQELLLKNEYLVAENRILKAHIRGRLLLSDGEKATLAEIAKRLGRPALAQIAGVAKPDTILAWFGKLIAKKFDGSKQRGARGRPRVGQELEDLVVKLARSNAGWGYDRIVGALANLGHSISDQTVGNILRRRSVRPAPEREKSTTWKDFIRSHMSVLAGTDFFTAEVLTWRGLVTYYVLFFIHLDTRRVSIAGIASRFGLDGADGTQRDLGGLGIPAGSAISAARSRREVQRSLPKHRHGGRSQAAQTAGEKPEFEFLCRALGAFGSRGMPVEAGAVGRGFVAPSGRRICHVFP